MGVVTVPMFLGIVYDVKKTKRLIILEMIDGCIASLPVEYV